MEVHIVTLFPDLFASPLKESILGKAIDRGVVDVAVHDLRDHAQDKHRTADDAPYGGGAGMVLKPEPIIRALRAIEAEAGPATVVLLTPQGIPFSQALAQRLSKEERLVLLCGRYEGVDERVRLHFTDLEISIGDYVLMGGEIPALVVLDATVRLLPGVVGEERSIQEDSFQTGLLDHPHYTRPAEAEGHKVPEVLISGNHEAIRRWRRKESLRRTRARRPDLLETATLTDEDVELLSEIEAEEASPE
ncbi:MAG: tRNA (guanosine(37)-N1)-methyltransferase TrmD [Nitrospinae bacterium]|nr:tRNA (guanosine(37)-N1)-methyltransferase TrmD [Nitrospinota bacterium]